MSGQSPLEIFFPEAALVKDASLEVSAQPVSLIAILSILWEYSWNQPQRTPTCFFVKPSWPIQEMYITRLLVNLLWFARNYLNLAAVCVFAGMFFSPPHALIVIGSLAVHFSKRIAFGNPNKSYSNDKDSLDPRSRGSKFIVIALTALHCISSLVICWMCGVHVVIILICTVAVPVISHALFTPYTDEAFEAYCDVLHRAGLPLPAPRSPTVAFDAKDPAFGNGTKRVDLVTPRVQSSTQRQEQSAPDLRHTFKGVRTQKRVSSEVPQVNKGMHETNDSLNASLGGDSMRRGDEESEEEKDKIENYILSVCKNNDSNNRNNHVFRTISYLKA